MEIIKVGEWEQFASTLPEPEYLLDRLIPSNAKTYLHGPPSAGKTAFAWSLANRAADQENFLGFTTKKTQTLYISLDMNGYNLKARWGTSFVPNFLVVLLPAFDCLNKRVMDTKEYKAVQDIIQTEEVGLIIVDTLGDIHIGHSTRDDEVADEVHAFIDRWFMGRGSILIAHDRKVQYDQKGKPRKPTDEDFLGSQRWRGKANNQLHIYPVNNQRSKICHAKAQLSPRYDDEIEVYIDEHGDVMLWDTAKIQQADDKLSQAYANLQLAGMKAEDQIKAIANYYNVNERTVWRWKALRKQKKEDDKT